MQPDSHFFLCYSHADESELAQNRAVLDQLGIGYWFDSNITGGRDWSDAIARAIEGSAGLVFFASPDSVNSDHCRREIAFAQDLGLKVVVVYLTPVNLPAGLKLALSYRQAVNKFSLSPDEFKSALRDALAGADEPTDYDRLSEQSLRSFGQRKSRTKFWVATIAIGALAAGLYLTYPTFNDPGVSSKPSPESDAPAAMPGDSQTKSIAILPFKVLPASAEELAAGIHAEITNQLAVIPDVKIIARTSVLQFAQSTLPIEDIARQLGVTHVLTATLRAREKRIRLAAEVVHVPTGERIWGESYDREAADIFDLESDIALRVANALQINLSDRLSDLTASPGTDNPLAHRAYLQALTMWKDFSPTRPIRAKLDEALQLDPEYADALAYKAWVLGVESGYGEFDGKWLSDKQREAKQELAKTIAEQALSLDANQSLAYLFLAGNAAHMRKWYENLAFVKKAYAIAPNDYRVRSSLGARLMQHNQVESGVQHFLAAVELNPMDEALVGFVAEQLIYSKQWQAAEKVVVQLSKLNSDNWQQWALKLYSYADLGDRFRFDDTVARVGAEHENGSYQFAIIYGYNRLYDVDRALEHVQRLTESRLGMTEDPFFRGVVAMMLGTDDEFLMQYLQEDLIRFKPRYSEVVSYLGPIVFAEDFMKNPKFKTIIRRYRTPRKNLGTGAVGAAGAVGSE